MSDPASPQSRQRLGTIAAIGCLAILALYFLPRGAAWYNTYTSDTQVAARASKREELQRQATETRHAAAVAGLTPADRAALFQLVRDYYAARPGWVLPAPAPTGLRDGDTEWVLDFDGVPERIRRENGRVTSVTVGGPGVSVHIDKKTRIVTRVLGWQ